MDGVFGQPYRPALLILLLIFVAVLTACDRYSDPALVRAKRIRDNVNTDILIGVGWPWQTHEDMFGDGLDLAVQEVNAAGGVLKRQLRLLRMNDDGSIIKGKKIAQSFADNPDMVMVIGHLHDHVSLVVSIIYQYAGLLVLSPGATHAKLTKQGFNRIFRTIPSSVEIGRRIANYSKHQNYKHLLICHTQKDNHKAMADIFEKEAERVGMSIVDMCAFTSDLKTDIKRVFAIWKGQGFNAVFLAADAQEGVRIITLMRESGMEVPVLGSHFMDSQKLIELGGASMEGLVVTSLFDATAANSKTRAFVQTFEETYGQKPDFWAAQGYDAIHLAAHTMNMVQSAVPDSIAEGLRTQPVWLGVTGSHTFTDNGDVLGKTITMKKINNGRFDVITPVKGKVRVK